MGIVLSATAADDESEGSVQESHMETVAPHFTLKGSLLGLRLPTPPTGSQIIESGAAGGVTPDKAPIKAPPPGNFGHPFSRP
jgi:hypothetical protein